MASRKKATRKRSRTSAKSITKAMRREDERPTSRARLERHARAAARRRAA